MKNTRKITKTTLVLNVLCAVIWTILAVMNLIDGASNTLVFVYILCAVVWFIAAIMNYIRYTREKDMKV